MDGLFMEPTASHLENLRSVARWDKRITHDCYNAKVTVDGGWVKCKAGHYFRSHTSKIPLEDLLAGASPLICRGCLDYVDGD